ncbi:MAG TPA: S41 family peptidase [Gemmatimonadales bacterium]|nr:S41 family peptidase [Gemmatimonadales bacterium]
MRLAPRAALLGLLAVPLTVAGFGRVPGPDRDGARLFEQVFTLVATQFVDSLGRGELYRRAAEGLVRSLEDPYAELVSPEELAEFNVIHAGRYGGVGLLVENHDGEFFVSRVFPDTPGERAGVQPGDRIVAVDGRSTEGWEFTRVTDALKGPPGTAVAVSLVRSGVATPIEVTVTRAVIHVPAVPHALMFEGRIGYVPLQKFSETSGREVEAAVRRMLREGARGLVLDLRGNGGGYTDQALHVSSLFLRAGQAVYRQADRAGAGSITYVSDREPLAPTVPLVVLTDEGSASAAEIVAGALQDHDRALIVGTTTYGKGLVQTAFPLDGGYVLKITTGRWFTPSGRSIQRADRMIGQARRVAAAGPPSEALPGSRPRYRSTGGRIIYGGGAITPDVVVEQDTLSGAEQEFVRGVASRTQDVYLALYDLAAELKPTVRPDFRVEPAWRERLYQRLVARGVALERERFAAAAGYVDRLIEARVARTAFGDSAAQRRAAATDAQLQRALALLRRGGSQAELLALSGRAAP